MRNSHEIKDDTSCFGESTHQGDFAVIEVIDCGKGVTEAEREHIFEPFYSTSDNGRGLGLAVVYGFVKSHNGFVQCTSYHEQGACFRLLLPLVPQLATQAPGSGKLPPEELESLPDLPRGDGKTVLMIDDDAGVLELCQHLLEVSGWKVIAARCGRDGLETLNLRKDEIDCVLLDVVMPDMSGGEVLNEMEAKKIATPVVLSSGFSKIQMETYFARPNVTAIISKPFHNREFLSALYHAAVCQEVATAKGKPRR